MSNFTATLLGVALAATTYTAAAGDGACNHPGKQVNASQNADKLLLASGMPEAGGSGSAGGTGTTDASGDMVDSHSTGSTDANTRPSSRDRMDRSGSGSSGGTGSTGAGTSSSGSTGSDTSGSGSMDNSTSGAGTGSTDSSSGM